MSSGKLLEVESDVARAWRGMPEFEQDDLAPLRSIKVHFESEEDVRKFARLVEQTITDRTRSLWYPEAEIGRFVDKRYATRGDPIQPRWPLYIVSKGRAESRLTNRALAEMGVRHYVVVEEAEREVYERNLDPLATVLVLPPNYKRAYELCDDLGLSKSTGPGPARNFAWDHAVGRLGAAWHWVMDDNISGFFRLNRNLKTPCPTGAFFRAQEDFVARCRNVAMAGPNYFMFASRKSRMPPFVRNTRIYSCNLIRNDLPFRWRGRYNEDTDLSLRLLKSGRATVQFNAFLQFKNTTQTLSGGNTEEFYRHEGTTPKSEMLERLHPDVARVVERWGRTHHFVDYGPFKTVPLGLEPAPNGTPEVDDYGMALERRRFGRWERPDDPESEDEPILETRGEQTALFEEKDEARPVYDPEPR